MRIDFYHIADRDHWHFSCRVVAKAYQHQCQTYIHMADVADVDRIDTLLWTYQQQSFIPHAKVGVYTTHPPLIEIGYQLRPIHHHELLVNLSLTIPDFFKAFKRMIEIVPQTKVHQQLATKHLFFYQAQGFIVNHYNLRVR